MSKESESNTSYVVGIGASAGGLEALESFFSSMPIDSGLTFIVIQHLAPDFKSLMAEGIEDTRQYMYVKSLGVDAVQGFYFAKPMAAESISTELLAA